MNHNAGLPGIRHMSPAPGRGRCLTGAGQEGEHEVELLLIKLVRGVTRYLVRWRGHTSADDSWREAVVRCAKNIKKYAKLNIHKYAFLKYAQYDKNTS